MSDNNQLPLPMVDVVIPVFNYAKTIERAIRSVKAQKLSNFACYIVDDGSTDNTREVVEEAIKDDARFHYIYKNNSGVADSRNTGVFSGNGKYICCLDADDAIKPEFLETCIDALEKDPTISIAYTGLWFIKPDKTEGLSPWPEEFDYDKQVAGRNQIPTCNVARREVWERLGGQRQRYAPDGAGEEDAEMWLRAGAYGFRAKKVTEAGLFLYSWMSGRVSGSKEHKMTDYRFYHPWVLDGKHPLASIAKPSNFSHPVRQYDNPLISVIIPVSDGHVDYVIDALDSLEAQTYRNWEAIVVDDASEKSKNLKEILDRSYPYAKYIKNEKKHGAGRARNLGVSIARAPFIVFLDADDWLHPDAFDKMLNAWDKTQSIIYTDHFGKAILSKEDAKGLGDRLLAHNEKNGIALFKHGWMEYSCELAQKQPNQSMYHWCVITTLIPKKWHNEIGGFDEEMWSWEDWDYYIRMAKAGKCFSRIPEPLFVYRYYTGTRREEGLRDKQKLIQYMLDKYQGKEDMGCNCKNQTVQNVPLNPNQPQISRDSIMQSPDNEFVLIQYTHPNLGQHRVIGTTTGTDYGYRAGGDKFLVNKRDIATQPHLFSIIQVDVNVPKDQKNIAPPKRIEEQIQASAIPESEDTDLQKVAGVSGVIAQQLNALGVHTISELAQLGEQPLTEIKGVGEKRARAIIASARLTLSSA